MADQRSDSPLLFDILPAAPNHEEETSLIRQGAKLVAGLDEAGRGPLAGPVVAAAVILDASDLPRGLDDSKRLNAHKRDALFDLIIEKAIACAISSVSAESIDTSDIRKASLKAMTRAANMLGDVPDFALVDGRDIPPGLPCPARALVKGDQRSVSIAAASILAKVTRDRMMERVGASHPAYGLERHAGYATRQHREAIAVYGGIERIHRFSFAPLKGNS